MMSGLKANQKQSPVKQIVVSAALLLCILYIFVLGGKSSALACMADCNVMVFWHVETDPGVSFFIFYPSATVDAMNSSGDWDNDSGDPPISASVSGAECTVNETNASAHCHVEISPSNSAWAQAFPMYLSEFRVVGSGRVRVNVHYEFIQEIDCWGSGGANCETGIIVSMCNWSQRDWDEDRYVIDTYDIVDDGMWIYEGDMSVSLDFNDGDSGYFTIDLIAFADAEYHLYTGQVMGYVTDSATGGPIKGAEVCINGYCDETDEDGYYLIESIPIGQYQICANAEDYEEDCKEIEIMEGITSRDLYLVPITGKYIIKGFVRGEDFLVKGLPVYVYQSGVSEPIWHGYTNNNGYYETPNLSLYWNPDQPKEFYVEAKWENNAVKIHDFEIIGSEVIRERRPEDGYMKIPQLDNWPDIVFDDEDAERDYYHASTVFNAINEAYNKIIQKYGYVPNQVNVYIHDWTSPTKTYPLDGSIHFSNDDQDYNNAVAQHEYGHAIHLQHVSGWEEYPGEMREAWALYFESLFGSWRIGDYNRNSCFYKNWGWGRDHSLGAAYAGIFIDIEDGESEYHTDDDPFDGNLKNGEKRIWQAIMGKKVKNIDEFYYEFVDMENENERDALNTIYATHGIISPIYKGNLQIEDFPNTGHSGEKVNYKVLVKNTGQYSLDYEVQVYVVEQTGFGCSFSHVCNSNELVDLGAGEEVEVSCSWDIDVEPGWYKIDFHLVPKHYNNTSNISCMCSSDPIAFATKHNFVVTDAEGMVILTTCPVDLNVIDPEGFAVTKHLIQVPEASYKEVDINNDGSLDDVVLIPNRKLGNYQIIVIPEPNAEPTDTYTLEVSAGDTTIVLAENVPISDIPAQPYIIESTEEGIFQKIPGDLDNDADIDQNDLNILLTYRNQPASACPECDIDGDGIITVLDARKLVLLCTRPRCACE